MDLEKTLTSRDSINTQLRGVLDEATGKWGLRVNRVEIKAIDSPKTINDAMEKQRRAERDERAAILGAEGHRQSQILTAEKDKQGAILRAEGERAAVILRAEAQGPSDRRGLPGRPPQRPRPQAARRPVPAGATPTRPGPGKHLLGHPQRGHRGPPGHLPRLRRRSTVAGSAHPRARLLPQAANRDRRQRRHSQRMRGGRPWCIVRHPLMAVGAQSRSPLTNAPGGPSSDSQPRPLRWPRRHVSRPRIVAPRAPGRIRTRTGGTADRDTDRGCRSGRKEPRRRGRGRGALALGVARVVVLARVQQAPRHDTARLAAPGSAGTCPPGSASGQPLGWRHRCRHRGPLGLPPRRRVLSQYRQAYGCPPSDTLRR